MITKVAKIATIAATAALTACGSADFAAETPNWAIQAEAAGIDTTTVTNVTAQYHRIANRAECEPKQYLLDTPNGQRVVASGYNNAQMCIWSGSLVRIDAPVIANPLTVYEYNTLIMGKQDAEQNESQMIAGPFDLLDRNGISRAYGTTADRIEFYQGSRERPDRFAADVNKQRAQSKRICEVTLPALIEAVDARRIWRSDRVDAIFRLQAECAAYAAL